MSEYTILHQPDPPFALTEADKFSPLWLRLSHFLADTLDDARKRNDSSLTETETAFLRGQIRLLKRLLALEHDRPVMTGELEPPYGRFREE